MENQNYKKWSNLRVDFEEFISQLFPVPVIDTVEIVYINGQKTYRLYAKGNKPLENTNPCIWHTPKDWNSTDCVLAYNSNSGLIPSSFYTQNGAAPFTPGDWVLITYYSPSPGISTPMASSINKYLSSPSWTITDSSDPRYIIGKPSVEVTGNKLTSNQTIASYSSNTTKYPTTKAVYDFVTGQGYQLVSNKVTAWSNSPSDTNYPSEKLVYDTIGDVETILNTIVGTPSQS